MSYNFDTYKIETFAGINDSPRKPTASKAGNGSHLISQFNSFVTLAEQVYNTLNEFVDQLDTEVNSIQLVLEDFQNNTIPVLQSTVESVRNANINYADSINTLGSRVTDLESSITNIQGDPTGNYHTPWRIRKDGTQNYYNTNVGDRVLIQVNVNTFELYLPNTPNQSDSIIVVNRGSTTRVNIQNFNNYFNGANRSSVYINSGTTALNKIVYFVYLGDNDGSGQPYGWIGIADSGVITAS